MFKTLSLSLYNAKHCIGEERIELPFLRYQHRVLPLNNIPERIPRLGLACHKNMTDVCIHRPEIHIKYAFAM